MMPSLSVRVNELSFNRLSLPGDLASGDISRRLESNFNASLLPLEIESE